MTTTRFSSDSNHVSSPVRSSIDVVAYTVHSLGFWPENSVVLVTGGARHMGPILRISAEIPKINSADAAELLSHYLAVMPQRTSETEPISQFFILIFGPAGCLRTRQLNPHTMVQASMDEIRRDARMAEKASSWILGSIQAAKNAQLDLVDIFYLGEVSRLEMSKEHTGFQFSGFIEDVLKSPIYLDLLTRGSVVTHREQESFSVRAFNAGETESRKNADAWNREALLWFDQYREDFEKTDSDYCMNFLAQKYAETALWNTAIDEVLKIIDDGFGHLGNRLKDAEYADCMRKALPPQVAGFMAAALTSPASFQFVLFAAGESLGAVEHLMNVVAREGGGFDLVEVVDKQRSEASLRLPKALMGDGIFLDTMRGLEADPKLFLNAPQEIDEVLTDRFGQIMMGQTVSAPDWGRLTALEYILALLMTVSEGSQLGRLFQGQAWIYWFKGSSSRACDALERAAQYLPCEDTPLSIMLESSMLPLWVSEPDQCWKQ